MTGIDKVREWAKMVRVGVLERKFYPESPFDQHNGRGLILYGCTHYSAYLRGLIDHADPEAYYTQDGKWRKRLPPYLPVAAAIAAWKEIV